VIRNAQLRATGVWTKASEVLATDEKHERRLLAGERLNHRADAERLLWGRRRDTSFRAATQTSPD
jgi:hypothetical protein